MSNEFPWFQDRGLGPKTATEIQDGLTLAEVEAIYIRRALEQAGDNVSQAAKSLGISRSTLWRKMKKLGDL